jgi:putative FmdB family regulatory protein
MPTYDYACDNCKHEFEEFQSITARPLKKCPKCARRTLRRLIGTGGGIIFKGSGFYQTDYRSEAYKKAAEAESKSATAGKDSKSAKETKDSKDQKSDKPAESKPATGGREKAKKSASKRGGRKAG